MNKKKKKPAKKSTLTFVKKGETRKLKLYVIDWTDHAANKETWVSLDEVKVLPITVRSVGYLIDETKEALALAQNVSNTGRVTEVITIIKSCIQLKREL